MIDNPSFIYLRILNKKIKNYEALIYRQRSLLYAFTYIYSCFG